MEGVLSRAGEDIYTINNHQKESIYEVDSVEKEVAGQVWPNESKNPNSIGADYIYRKALYHTLPMNYVSVAKLQNKLEGEADQTTVRKLIDWMTQDGFVDPKGNRRLGKRVIHSELTERKLLEVTKAIKSDAMDLDSDEAIKKHSSPEFQKMACKNPIASGGLHSIGSHLTRTRGKSDMNLTGQTVSKMSRTGNTPTSGAQPIPSSKSFAPWNENGRANGNVRQHNEGEAIMCSISSQEKRSRKTSTVKEPIVQYMKRQKSEAV